MQLTDSRRDRLLAAARREFADFGYAGARVARIAERAAVNKQLLYYYFGSKAGLHAEATRLPVGGAEPPATTTAPPERLRRAVDRISGELRHDPALAASLTERHLAAGVRQALTGRMDAWLTSLTEIVSDGQGEGYFRDDVDPVAMARQALVLCAGIHGLAPTLTLTEPARESWPVDVASLLLRALTW